jgi:hypothetical protein
MKYHAIQDKRCNPISTVSEGIQLLPAEIRAETLYTFYPDEIEEECGFSGEMQRVCASEKFWEEYARRWNLGSYAPRFQSQTWKDYVTKLDRRGTSVKYSTSVEYPSAVYRPEFHRLDVHLAFGVYDEQKHSLYGPNLTGEEREKFARTILNEMFNPLVLQNTPSRIKLNTPSTVEVHNYSRDPGSGVIILKYRVDVPYSIDIRQEISQNIIPYLRATLAGFVNSKPYRTGWRIYIDPLPSV